MNIDYCSALRRLTITRQHVLCPALFLYLTVLSFSTLTVASSPDWLPEVHAPTLTNPLLSDRVSSVEMNRVMYGLVPTEALAVMTKSNVSGKISRLPMGFQQ